MKENKTKIRSFSNFFYSLKLINKIDKIFIVEFLITSILSSLTVIIYPYILKVVIEGIELHKDIKEILLKSLIIIVIYLILIIVRNTINYDIYVYRINKISYKLTKDFHMKSLDYDYEKFEVTDMQDDYQKAGNALDRYGGIIDLISNSFTMFNQIIVFVVSSSIILTVNGWLILCIVGLSIFKLLLENYKEKKQKIEYFDKLPNIRRRINYSNYISRNLSIGKDLRIYEMNKFISKVRNASTKDLLDLKKKNSRRIVFICTLIYILKFIDEIILYGFMIYEVLYNNMIIATFTFMITTVKNMVGSINQIIKVNSEITSCSLRVNDYREFLKYDFFNDSQVNEINDLEIDIEFKNVYYSYIGQDGYALENVSFKINRGERIALVGFNGAGKTTLIKLICGFYHPTKGEILINGINIETIKRESLLSLLAPVFQDVGLYAIEVIENISMKTNHNTDIDEAKKAMEIVNIIDKINELPLKEKTIITREFDDKGIELSGGESQKLTIARAIYKNAPLIMLDEPTSSLDSIAESNLYQNLNEIIKSSSAIFISHRLSSTKFCDRILLLENGKLIEEGRHEDLMESETKYKEMFNMQARYYVDGEADE